MIDLENKTYLATLYSPLFYSSSEGAVLRTDKILGSTALTYALAYEFGLVKKHYFLQGDESKNYNYKELSNIGLFVSDAEPLDVEFTNETFKSAEYLSERSLTVNVSSTPSKNKGENPRRPTRFEKTDPREMGTGKPGLNAKVRRIIGLAPGSTFAVTIWSKTKLPDDIFLTLGIRRSGEIRLRRTELAKKVCLNKFMLREVYGFSDKLSEKGVPTLFDVFSASDRNFTSSSDYRMQHFSGIDLNFVDTKVIPFVFREQHDDHHQ